DLQSGARGTACELGIKFREIHTHAVQKNGLDLFALIEQHGGGKLDGSIHGEIGVGDDFEACACFRDHCFRAAGGYPGKFHLRESGNLGNSAEREGERIGVGHETVARHAVVRVIEKNFVHNQTQTVVAAESVERL